MVKDAYSKDNIKRVSDLFIKKANEQFEDKTELNISEITEELSCWVTAELLNFPLYKPYIKDVVLDSQKHNPFATAKDHIENYDEKYEKLSANYKKLVETAERKIQKTV